MVRHVRPFIGIILEGLRGCRSEQRENLPGRGMVEYFDEPKRTPTLRVIK